jgi:hypothetical protein
MTLLSHGNEIFLTSKSRSRRIVPAPFGVIRLRLFPLLISKVRLLWGPELWGSIGGRIWPSRHAEDGFPGG